MLTDALMPTRMFFRRAETFLAEHLELQRSQEPLDSAPLALMRGRQQLSGLGLTVGNCYMTRSTWSRLTQDTSFAQSLEWFDPGMGDDCMCKMYGMYFWAVPNDDKLFLNWRRVLYYADYKTTIPEEYKNDPVNWHGATRSEGIHVPLVTPLEWMTPVDPHFAVLTLS